MIRDILLVVYVAAWAAVVVITALRTGTVPPELWAVPGIGVGAFLAAFHTNDRSRRRSPAEEPEAVEDTPS
jgi:ABC-type enterobactin transport system permease subunit